VFYYRETVNHDVRVLHSESITMISSCARSPWCNIIVHPLTHLQNCSAVEIVQWHSRRGGAESRHRGSARYLHRKSKSHSLVRSLAAHSGRWRLWMGGGVEVIAISPEVWEIHYLYVNTVERRRLRLLLRRPVGKDRRRG